MAAGVLDVVAEDVEEQHVPEEVYPAPVEEDAGHEGVVAVSGEHPSRDQAEHVDGSHEVAVPA